MVHETLAKEWHRSLSSLVTQFAIPLNMLQCFLDGTGDCATLGSSDVLPVKQLQAHKCNKESTRLVAWEFLDTLPAFHDLLVTCNFDNVQVGGKPLLVSTIAHPFTSSWVQVPLELFHCIVVGIFNFNSNRLFCNHFHKTRCLLQVMFQLLSNSSGHNFINLHLNYLMCFVCCYVEMARLSVCLFVNIHSQCFTTLYFNHITI